MNAEIQRLQMLRFKWEDRALKAEAELDRWKKAKAKLDARFLAFGLEQRDLHALRANAEKIKDAELERLREENRLLQESKMCVHAEPFHIVTARLHRIEEAARRHARHCLSQDVQYLIGALEEK